MTIKNIKNISVEDFKGYGEVIELKPTSVDGWEIVVTEPLHGWRIAVLEVKRKLIDILEKHPESKESFEPMQGVTLLVVAKEESPDDFEVFLLDKPVCLHKGVWHQVISLTHTSLVKITENLEVECVYHNLGKSLICCMTEALE